MIHQRKKKNSSKVNLTISVVFHVVVILVAFVFAAREGMLGNKLKQITATLVPKEKKPEPPKPKPEEPKEEPRKTEEPKVAAVPKAIPAPTSTAPPPADSPSVAPAAAVLSGFEFAGGKEVVSMASDPRSLYKAKVERTLREAWKRPNDLQDEKFVAQVDVTIEATGKIAGYRWVSGSGNTRWDASVREAVESTKNVGTPPPKGFPPNFEVRFDVESEAVEGLRLSKL